jgi:hypothetical protein
VPYLAFVLSEALAMDKSTIIRRIRTEIRELDQLLTRWEGGEEECNQLSSKCLNIFEQQVLLRNFSSFLSREPSFAPLEETEISPPIPAPSAIDSANETAIPRPVSKPKPTVIEENIVNDPISSVHSAPENPVPQPVFIPGIKPPTHVGSFNDMNAPVTSVADRLRQTKINSLEKAIPLHEKFLFVSELFQGNNELYANFIRCLDASEDISQAQLLFESELNNRKWDSESTVVMKFMVTMQRKFL